MRESRKVSDELKKFYNDTLEEHEEEHEVEIVDKREDHKKNKIKLEQEWDKLEKQQKELSDLRKVEDDEREKARSDYESAQQYRKNMEKILREKEKQIELLDQEN